MAMLSSSPGVLSIRRASVDGAMTAAKKMASPETLDDEERRLWARATMATCNMLSSQQAEALVNAMATQPRSWFVGYVALGCGIPKRDGHTQADKARALVIYLSVIQMPVATVRRAFGDTPWPLGDGAHESTQ